MADVRTPRERQIRRKHTYRCKRRERRERERGKRLKERTYIHSIRPGFQQLYNDMPKNVSRSQ